MRHVALLVVALALTGCPRGGGDTTPARPATPKDVVAAARATIEQWRQAYEVRSVDALGKLYVRDLDLVVVDNGQQVVGWTSVEGMLRDRFARYERIFVRLKDIQVQSLGPTAAVATAAMTREQGDDVTTISEGGALTIVLRKDGEQWRIVSEHYSARRGSS